MKWLAWNGHNGINSLLFVASQCCFVGFMVHKQLSPVHNLLADRKIVRFAFFFGKTVVFLGKNFLESLPDFARKSFEMVARAENLKNFWQNSRSEKRIGLYAFSRINRLLNCWI